MQFKDEKCIQIIDKTVTQTFEKAHAVCASKGHEVTLLAIRSQEEQDFIQQYLLKKIKVVDNVWLGAKIDHEGLYKWEDNSDLSYSNWANGRPQNVSDHCVEFVSEEPMLGKWIDVSCKKKNLVLCQRIPMWTLPKIQETMIIMRKELKDALDQINSLKLKHQDLFPTGFTYIQFSNQDDPMTTWPNTTWDDVTAEYAGNFFRAEGGLSDIFGTEQNQSMPVLTVKQKADSSAGCDNCKEKIGDVCDTNWIHTGSDKAGKNINLNFCVSKQEVRPQNQAIKIWKKTK
jgi:hypothetical protein